MKEGDLVQLKYPEDALFGSDKGKGVIESINKLNVVSVEGFSCYYDLDQLELVTPETEIESIKLDYSPVLTKREQFAMAAMERMAARCTMNKTGYDLLAKASVEIADALIKELNK